MIKNVIIVCDHTSITGGTAKVAISSALGLARLSDINVVYFGGSKPIDRELLEQTKVICLDQYSTIDDPVRFRAVFQGLWNRKAEKEFAALLQQYCKEDTVVHIHGWTKVLSSSVIDVSCRMGFKTFISLHDYFLYCPNGGFYNFRKHILCDKRPMSLSCIGCNCDVRSFSQKCWRVVRQVIQNRVVDKYKNKIAYISISELSERVLLREFGKEIKVFRLNHMIDRLSIGLSNKKRDSYIFLARLSPEKGLDLFCEAITKLGLNGIVCGDGEQIEEYKKKYPTILFTGWANNEEKAIHVAKAKCCVFSSKCFETFGLTVAEMLSAGIPCIVAKQNAAAEMIIDGKNGLLFDSGSLESLVSTIETFEENSRNFSAETVKSTFDFDKFSLDNHIKGLVGIYNT